MTNTVSATNSPETRCHSCGRSPAIHVHFVAAVGRLVVMFEESYDDFLCRKCGLALYDRVMKRHLLNTWWSPKAILFGSTIATARNLYERSKLLNLPDPQRFEVAVTRPAPPQPEEFPKLEPPPPLPPPKPVTPPPSHKPSALPMYVAVGFLWAVALAAAYFTAEYVTDGGAREIVRPLGGQVQGETNQGSVAKPKEDANIAEQVSELKPSITSGIETVSDLESGTKLDSQQIVDTSPGASPDAVHSPKPAEAEVPKVTPVTSTAGKVTRIATSTSGNRLSQVHFDHSVDGWEGKRLSIWRRDEAGNRSMLGNVVVVKARDQDLVAATVVYTSGMKLVDEVLADYDFVRVGDEVESAATAPSESAARR